MTLPTIKRTLLLFMVLFSSLTFAQNYLEVPVMLDVEGGKMEGVLVKVKKNGKDAFTQSGSSKMRLKLDFNKEYTLVFTKDGYITKTIEFNTQVPSERMKSGFEPYTIGVKLYPQESDKHIVMYNQAVGIIRFDKVLDEFNYETDYSKSILSNMSDPNEKDKEKEKENAVDESQPEENKVADQPVSNSKDSRKKKSQDPPKKTPGNTSAPVNKPGSGQFAGANDVPPVGNGAAGNDMPPPPGGTGGNDVPPGGAMAAGSDPAGGMRPSSGNDINTPRTGHEGSDTPSMISQSASGSEANNRAFMPATGQEYASEGEMFETVNITREDIVEDNRIITIVRVTKRNTTTEFRKVTYRWGGPYYFQDNKLSISQDVFAFYTGVRE